VDFVNVITEMEIPFLFKNIYYILILLLQTFRESYDFRVSTGDLSIEFVSSLCDFVHTSKYDQIQRHLRDGTGVVTGLSYDYDP
jgi:hypothetical protein